MKNHTKFSIAFITLFVLATTMGYVMVSKYTNQTGSGHTGAEIASFEECVSAGYAVKESYPMQCATPGGQTFTQEIHQPPTDNNDPINKRVISLFYYSETKDIDETGNIKCSADGLVAVARTIPVSESPLQDAVNLLLTGELTEEETDSGITTEFPLPGLTFKGVTVDDDGILVLQFDDPEFSTSGGSCRTNILWQQIQTTATQFDTIDQVRFAPEELFQP